MKGVIAASHARHHHGKPVSDWRSMRDGKGHAAAARLPPGHRGWNSPGRCFFIATGMLTLTAQVTDFAAVLLLAAPAQDGWIVNSMLRQRAPRMTSNRWWLDWRAASSR